MKIERERTLNPLSSHSSLRMIEKGRERKKEERKREREENVLSHQMQ